MAIQSYKDLDVWQKSMDLVVEVYNLTRLFPKEEQFGLTSQIRRAVISVPSNIAEGHGRLYVADYIRHLSIARGSLAETKTQLEIATRLSYVDRESIREVWHLTQDIGRLLNALIKSLANRENGSVAGSRIFEETEPYQPDEL